MISKVEQKIKEIEWGLPENIRQVQLPNLPSVNEIILIEKDSYNYKGSTYKATDKRMFLVYNLPINPAVNKKNVFNKTLQAAVDENLIHPFILFINGKAVKWSSIEVIVDYKYSYLLINTAESVTGNIFNGKFYAGFINITTGDIGPSAIDPDSIYSDEILVKGGIPYKITGQNVISWRIRKWDLGHNYIGSDNGSGTSYTFTPANDMYIRVLFYTGADVTNFQIISNYGKSSQKMIKIPYRVRYGEDNITNVNYKGNFYFDSTGLLTSNAASIAMRVEIISSELNCTSSDYSKGYVEVVSDSYDKPATKENVICFKNGLLSDESASLIDNGCNIFKHSGVTTGVIFKTFYYIKGNSSIDNLYKLDNTTVKNNIINNTGTTYMNKLKEKLSLDVSPTDGLDLLCNLSMQNVKILAINNNKFLVAFSDTSVGNKGTVFIAEYVNDVLTFGSNYIFNNTDTVSISLVRINNDRILVLYSDGSDNLKGKAVIITISNTNMILSSVFTFSNASIFNLNAVKVSNNKYLVAYSNLLNSNYGTAQMLTITPDFLSINSGPIYAFTSEAVSELSIVNTDTEYACICYRDTNGFGAANIITIDGLGILVSSKYIFNSEVTSKITASKISNGRVVVTYLSNKKATVQLLNIDGKSISILPKHLFNTSDSIYLSMSSIDDSNFLIVFDDAINNMVYGTLIIDDNNISYNYEYTTPYKTIGEVIPIGLYNKLCIIFTDTAQTNKGFIYHTHNLYNKLNMKLEKIMNYNPTLLDSIYSELIPFETVIYTGSQINARRDEQGYLTMPRRRYNNIFCYVMIYLNGELYENYYTITYINDKFKVFIGTTLADTDCLEFVFIKNVNNSVASITVPDKDTIIKSNSKFNEDNLNLFSSEAESREYILPNGTNIVYNIPFTVITNGDDSYNITLDSNFYYGKSLTVVSDSLFKYKKFVVEYNQVDLPLGDDFKYCINKNKYMVFINGRMINSSNFELALPSTNNPFDQPILYINMIIIPGQEVEVFYLPFETVDIITMSDMPADGDISVDTGMIPFNLSKNRYWFFVNGKKVNPNDINDISDSRINIKTDYKSTYNLTIVRYMNPMDVISKLVANQDNWSSIINLLGTGIKSFYSYTTFTNTETDIKVNETDMKATILEAFRQYYAKYNISSDSLLYDFNDILIDSNNKDSDGNYIIYSSDANKTNSVDVDR